MALLLQKLILHFDKQKRDSLMIDKNTSGLAYIFSAILTLFAVFVYVPKSYAEKEQM